MPSGCSHDYEFVLRPISSLTVQQPEGHQCLTGLNSIVLANDKPLLDSNFCYKIAQTRIFREPTIQTPYQLSRLVQPKGFNEIAAILNECCLWLAYDVKYRQELSLFKNSRRDVAYNSDTNK